MNLSTALNFFVRNNKLGKVFAAAVDLYLDEQSNAVQPDILFISKDNLLKTDREGLHGVPNLIIEILSPGNRDHGRIIKKRLHEKFGVKEYWVIDPETKMATGYSLKDATYHPIVELKDKIDSPLLGSIFEY